MLTSSNATIDMDMSEEQGAIAYIEKPLSVDKVREVILEAQKLKMCIVCEEETGQTHRVGFLTQNTRIHRV